MLSRAFHIVACLLLVMLGICERALPCGDDHHCNETSSAAISSADHCGDQDHTPVEGDHHCDRCGCLCHMAALTPLKSSSVVLSIPARRYHPISHFPPSAPVDPLDHVPLA
jgi:hypothetical protein